jgi:hypothetical protein
MAAVLVCEAASLGTWPDVEHAFLRPPHAFWLCAIPSTHEFQAWAAARSAFLRDSG